MQGTESMPVVHGQAIFRALDEVKQEAWFDGTTVYLYRGAWQEWEPWEADMCVPLSAADLEAKVGRLGACTCPVHALRLRHACWQKCMHCPSGLRAQRGTPGGRGAILGAT